jgi:sigma-B regulation protein RsbU (phosphoserine phosphatase)
LFSDGLPEFPNISGDRIGEAGLVVAVDAVKPDLAPGDVIDGLCRVTGIADADMLPDDTTIICIDRRGGPLPEACKQCVLSGDRLPASAESHPMKQEEPGCLTN